MQNRFALFFAFALASRLLACGDDSDVAFGNGLSVDPGSAGNGGTEGNGSGGEGSGGTKAKGGSGGQGTDDPDPGSGGSGDGGADTFGGGGTDPGTDPDPGDPEPPAGSGGGGGTSTKGGSGGGGGTSTKGGSGGGGGTSTKGGSGGGGGTSTKGGSGGGGGTSTKGGSGGGGGSGGSGGGGGSGGSGGSGGTGAAGGTNSAACISCVTAACPSESEACLADADCAKCVQDFSTCSFNPTVFALYQCACTTDCLETCAIPSGGCSNLYREVDALRRRALSVGAMKRSLLFAACFVGVSVISGEAAAFEKFTVGGGVMGAIGGSFQNKPGNKTIPGTQAEDTTYPGFGGFNGPMPGVFIEGRALGIVGLEIDFLFQQDRAHGDITINGNAFTVEIGQKALHIPVLVKATLPSPLFAPNIFIGPEFVRPGTGEVSITPAGLQGLSAKADNYTMLTMGLGGEFKLPIPSVDIRIPFSLRGSIQPGFSDTLSDRAKYDTSGTGLKVEYNSAWRYQALATLGAAVHF